MARLTRLKPTLQGMAPRVAYLERDADRDRTDRNPLRHLYKTARWQKLRWQVLVRDLFTCQCGCGRTLSDTSKLVADHKTAHRGDERLFWDINNLQCLTKPCHDSAKQKQEAEERRGLRREGGVESLEGRKS
jgi:5-methylcytosine-specific restriction enzyme A